MLSFLDLIFHTYVKINWTIISCGQIECISFHQYVSFKLLANLHITVVNNTAKFSGTFIEVCTYFECYRSHRRRITFGWSEKTLCLHDENETKRCALHCGADADGISVVMMMTPNVRSIIICQPTDSLVSCSELGIFSTCLFIVEQVYWVERIVSII